MVGKRGERAEFEKGGSCLFVGYAGDEAASLLLESGGGVSEEVVDIGTPEGLINIFHV
jgi:hypothetical protein